MSQIKTTEIEGDVAIGRHVTAGGNATIQGNTTVKKNLKVEGWLDARNIKGPNKGIFLDVTKLREAYPLPHDGWWALVGNTLPAPLYIADGGAWVATGETAGNPTIDSQQYNDAVAALDADLKELAKDVSANAQSIEKIRTQINTIGSSVNTLTSDVSGLKNRVSNAETRISTAEGNIRSITNSKGMPNGIAPLDEYEKIPARFIPGAMDDVKDFAGFTTRATLSRDICIKSSEDAGCAVLYNRETKRFILNVTTTAGQLVSDVYYGNWDDAELFGTSDTRGRIPHKDKIYVDTSTNKTYRWSGTDLVVIGSDLALGHTESTAYPGSEGLELYNAFNNFINNVLPTLASEAKLDTYKDIALSDNAKLSGVRVLPFDGVYTPAEGVQEPSSGIWYLPASNKFAVKSTYGYSASEYNVYDTATQTEGNARTDTVFRCGGSLYRVKNGKLQEIGALSVSEDLSLSADNELSLTDKAKMRLFIDQWDAAWKVSGTVYGKYDPEHAPDALHPFMGNDVWMTYEEAIQIMNCAATLSAYQRIAFNFLNVRTLPPIPLGFYVTYVDINNMREMECIRFVQAQSPNYCGIAPANLHFLYDCLKLKRIEGVISLENFSAQCLNGFFLKGDAALKEVRLIGLKTNISLVSSPLLSLASLQYLIANAANTATITVTVHKDVYAKLTGDTTNAAAAALTEEELAQWQALVTTAAAKSISFATV